MNAEPMKAPLTKVQPISARDDLQRYGEALLAAVAALYMRKLLGPALGAENPFHTAWAAVVFSAWYCGVGPSIFVVLVNLTGVWYWFLPPAGSFQLANPKAGISGILGFVVFSGVIVALGEANRRSLARSQLAEEQLRSAQIDLERKVQERTAELSVANENLRELSGTLQQHRDEEHRKIARELHDSVGQLLAALSMNIATIEAQSRNLDSAGARAVSENAALVQQISKEIRTISHLLHPPLLEAAGLTSALSWYVDGFSERSNIKVEMEIPPKFPRLSDAMEIAIFRLVQECLTNIHRHSGSNQAKIAIRDQDNNIVVEIKDAGKGISLEKQLDLSSGRAGVGFRGMRERLRRFGGDLNIQSDDCGTLVKAMIPLQSNAVPTADREKAS
jgi:signal transduction histidine kinase